MHIIINNTRLFPTDIRVLIAASLLRLVVRSTYFDSLLDGDSPQVKQNGELRSVLLYAEIRAAIYHENGPLYERLT